MDQAYINSLYSLEGQVVVVTGGSGILCSAMAKGIARAGAKVALISRSRAPLDRVVHEIVAAGGNAMACPADVTDSAALTRCCDEIMAQYGHIDGLINGAGGNRAAATTSPERSFFELSEEAMEQVFALNFQGTLRPIQVFGKVMTTQGHGSIINIASMASIRPLTKSQGYAAAKAAVKNLTEWCAVHMCQEYSPGIRVNSIAPGFFLTEQNRYLLTDEATGEMVPRGKRIIDHTPMGRYGVADDLVATAIYLLSPGSAFVTGTMAVVDGGFAAYGGV